MILVDSSVWIDHLRRADDGVLSLLREQKVLSHPFVIGELALGSIRPRTVVIAALLELQQAPVASDAEVLAMVEAHALHGTGIGYVDAHLIASTRLAAAHLLTRDKRLAAVALRLGVAALTA